MKTMRPPCRQSDNLFDLDEVMPKNNRKVIRIVRKQERPPSRHKTPPKAVGLEPPPMSYSIDHYSTDLTPNSYLSNTQTIHTATMNEKKIKVNKVRVGSVKGKPMSKANTNMNSRAWSATQKEKTVQTPINKRKNDSLQGISASMDSSYTPIEASKRSTSRVKNQNIPLFNDMQTEFLDLFA